MKQVTLKQSALMSALVWGVSLIHSYKGYSASQTTKLESVQSKKTHGLILMAVLCLFSYSKLQRDLL